MYQQEKSPLLLTPHLRGENAFSYPAKCKYPFLLIEKITINYNTFSLKIKEIFRVSLESLLFDI